MHGQWCAFTVHTSRYGGRPTHWALPRAVRAAPVARCLVCVRPRRVVVVRAAPVVGVSGHHLRRGREAESKYRHHRTLTVMADGARVWERK